MSGENNVIREPKRGRSTAVMKLVGERRRYARAEYFLEVLGTASVGVGSLFLIAAAASHANVPVIVLAFASFIGASQHMATIERAAKRRREGN